MLGVLGSLNVYPEVLLPVAAIVFGAGLILGAGANVRINELVVVHREDEAAARYAIRQAVLATTGLQVFVGLAAVTLGIIALASSITRSRWAWWPCWLFPGRSCSATPPSQAGC